LRTRTIVFRPRAQIEDIKQFSDLISELEPLIQAELDFKSKSTPGTV